MVAKYASCHTFERASTYDSLTLGAFLALGMHKITSSRSVTLCHGTGSTEETEIRERAAEGAAERSKFWGT
jgi:hypothetical protein